MITDMRIGVLAGGNSAEREVSLRSGAAVCKAFEEKGYRPVFIDTKSDIAGVLGREKIGIAFLALHGGTGEDGCIQGMLEVLGIPYTGSGVLASAMAMDKEASKKVFLYHGLPVPSFRIIRKPCPDAGRMCESIFDQFPLPWVVKPSSEGSSIGVSVVTSPGDFENALESAFRYGPTVIVEQFIEGKEISIGILGSKALGGIEVRPRTGFYSYEAKYTSGMTEYLVSPTIGAAALEHACSLGLEAHTVLGCRGFSRVDLIVDGDGHSFILEVNTIPGMTATSLLPKIAGHAGIGFPSLVEEILRLALPGEH